MAEHSGRRSRKRRMRGIRRSRNEAMTSEVAPANTPAVNYLRPPSSKNFIQFLIDEKGGTDFLIDAFDSVIDLASYFWKKNRVYQRSLNLLRYLSPTYFISSELLEIYKKWVSQEKNSSNFYSEKMYRVQSLLGADETSKVESMQFKLGPDVVRWIFSNPKTNKFTVKNFYKVDNLDQIDELLSIDKSHMFIVLNYNECTFVWEFGFSRYDEYMVVHTTELHFLSEHLVHATNLRSLIFSDFLSHFDINRNVLICDPMGLKSRQRMVCEDKINQFDVDAFGSEINKVLSRGLKRGYAIVGVPGVGKSTIIRKLEHSEHTMRFPFVYISKSAMSSELNVDETFQVLRSMQPFIAVLEDGDSLGFDHKNSKLGRVLDEIDAVNRNLNGVIIMVINDTSLVHYSLINRPGRFDEIIQVTPPRTVAEIYQVMSIHYDKISLSSDYLTSLLPKMHDIDAKIFEEIKEGRYTQADICEIIDKALLIEDQINNGTIHRSFENLKKSKRAIKDCNFKKSEPVHGYDISEEKSVTESHSELYRLSTT